MSNEPLHIMRFYREATSLLVEANSYAVKVGNVSFNQNDTRLRLNFAFHSMRVTSRLTHIMAWGFAQKAVYAGEFTFAQAERHGFQIPDIDIYTSSSGADDEALPTDLRSLLRRSHSLYTRVLRYDRHTKLLAQTCSNTSETKN